MSLVVISIDRTKLPSHTQEQFEEWVKYKVGDIGSMFDENPLSNLDMEASVREVSL